jgi:chemotaxis protein methyltransferase CheR
MLRLLEQFRRSWQPLTFIVEDVSLIQGRGESELWCWCAGCASGEEPYTLKILWALGMPPDLACVPLRIIATDADEAVLRRARAGCYAAGNLKDLPHDLRECSFLPAGDGFQVQDDLRDGIE